MFIGKSLRHDELRAGFRNCLATDRSEAQLEEARGEAEAQQAERTASMSHELAAERTELQQAEQARPHPHAYLLTP